MAINPHQDIHRNPRLHKGLNPFILTMSEELFALNQMNTMVSQKTYDTDIYELIVSARKEK